MAGKGRPKTGGRRKGVPNALTARSRKRFLRKATPTFDNLLDYTGNPENWKANPTDCLRAGTKLLEWLIPRYKPQESDAQQSAATAADPSAEPPAVSVEGILAAFKAHKPRPQPPAALPQPTRPAELTQTLPAREAEALRHAGIPQSDGSRVIPAAKRAPREHHADPKLPEPAIDAEPAIDYRVPTGSLRTVEAACQFVDQHESDYARVSASAGELPASLQRPRRGR